MKQKGLVPSRFPLVLNLIPPSDSHLVQKIEKRNTSSSPSQASKFNPMWIIIYIKIAWSNNNTITHKFSLVLSVSE